MYNFCYFQEFIFLRICFFSWKVIIIPDLLLFNLPDINYWTLILTLHAPISKKVVCFSRLLKCLRSLYVKPIGAVCSGSMLFAFILNLSVMLGNYLQQVTSADSIFRCIFFLALYGLRMVCSVSRINNILHLFLV